MLRNWVVIVRKETCAINIYCFCKCGIDGPRYKFLTTREVHTCSWYTSLSSLCTFTKPVDYIYNPVTHHEGNAQCTLICVWRLCMVNLQIIFRKEWIVSPLLNNRSCILATCISSRNTYMYILRVHLSIHQRL